MDMASQGPSSLNDLEPDGLDFGVPDDVLMELLGDGITLDDTQFLPADPLGERTAGVRGW
jgi:hypothetical protein